MRNATNARIGRGKAVHIYYSWVVRTDCGAGGMGDVDGIETEDAVTCKRCLKALAAQITWDHQEALDMDAARPVLSTTNTPSTKESPMRKLSEAQAKALSSIHVTGYAPEAKRLTLESLVTRGDLEFTAGGYQVTAQGRTSLGVPAPVVDKAEEFRESFREHISILIPVFEEPRLNVTRGHQSAEHVQGVRAALLEPVNGHAISEEKADEILDTWHEVSNRADRRAQAHQDKVTSRRDMRRRVTPKRRRFTSPGAKLRKAVGQKDWAAVETLTNV